MPYPDGLASYADSLPVAMVEKERFLDGRLSLGAMGLLAWLECLHKDHEFSEQDIADHFPSWNVPQLLAEMRELGYVGELPQ